MTPVRLVQERLTRCDLLVWMMWPSVIARSHANAYASRHVDHTNPAGQRSADKYPLDNDKSVLARDSTSVSASARLENTACCSLHIGTRSGVEDLSG